MRIRENRKIITWQIFLPLKIKTGISKLKVSWRGKICSFYKFRLTETNTKKQKYLSIYFHWKMKVLLGWQETEQIFRTDRLLQLLIVKSKYIQGNITKSEQRSICDYNQYIPK